MADFSVHWPLTFRKPSLEPLELRAEQREAYARWLRRAEEVGEGRCGCVIVDRAGCEVASGKEATVLHPLRHAVMVAIEAVSASLPGMASKRPRSDDEYLCQDCEVVTTHEPCLMC